MPGLRIPLPNRAARDRGATTVMVAIFVPIVFIATLALTVDYGGMMFERRQLQNAADASALAFARMCSKSSATCDPSLAGTTTALAPLLSGNSADGLSQLNKTAAMPYGICGRLTGGTNIVDCPSASSAVAIGDLSQCLPLPTWLTTGSGASAAYVEVYTKTLVAAGASPGTSILPSFFSQALPGSPGSNTTETVCSRAAWGALGSTPPTMPFVIGQCNWDNATSNGTSYAPSGAATSANASPLVSVPTALRSYITTIFGHVNGSETSVLQSKICLPDLSSPPSGSYTPGGFGWVKTCADLGAAAPASCTGAPPCTAVFSDTGTVGASPGASPSSGCSDANLASYVGTEVYVPVITAVSGTGGNAVYTVSGISSFFLAGYKNLAGGVTDKNAYISTDSAYRAKTCDPDASSWKSACVWGWFTSPVMPIGSMGGGGGMNRGPVVVADAG